jgi:uncharacterized protein (DUF1800 family)
MDMNAAIALNHFGLGHRLGETPPADAKAWLRGQLIAPDPTPVEGFPDSAACLTLVWEHRQTKKAEKSGAPAAEAATAADPHAIGERLKAEVTALLANALTTQAPFRERLVWFWANHFTIAAHGGVPAACAGAYVREAIRPHVTGRFGDMLLAVMRHPAMLTYLNQENSTGPDSQAGEKQHRGLNENLARECLELHTISPAAGYTQQDVTNFAKVLTGWSVDLKDVPRGFKFRARLHEPGEIEVLGRAWPEGEAGGRALLAYLGTHPATYRHLAEKLVRHFAGDDPRADDVRRIATVLQHTQGDLGAASAALIDLPGAWVSGTKLRPPQDYVIACLRAVGATPDQVPNLAGIVAGLGQGVFQAPFPIGWPDRAADWSSSEAMLQRVDFAYGLAGKMAMLDPAALGQTTLGPLLTGDIMSHIKGAGSRRDGLTMLLASPVFLRR